MRLFVGVVNWFVASFGDCCWFWCDGVLCFRVGSDVIVCFELVW